MRFSAERPSTFKTNVQKK